MKIGFYCESPVDQAALAVFCEGLLGQPPEPISLALQARPLGAFLKGLDGVIRGVHYNSDADGLVIVVDSDDTELHAPAHEEAGKESPNCRLCQVRSIIERARNQLKPRHTSPLRIAVGLAVPAIEAWYLLGKNRQVGESLGRDGQLPRTRLKQLVYGTDRPGLARATECALQEARRLASDLKSLETAFPMGFGTMAAEMRTWASPAAQ